MGNWCVYYLWVYAQLKLSCLHVKKNDIYLDEQKILSNTCICFILIVLPVYESIVILPKDRIEVSINGINLLSLKKFSSASFKNPLRQTTLQ